MTETNPDALGPCGCVDYHMSDCPLRTAAIDSYSQQEYNRDRYLDEQEDS